jgi:hypothetical protein
VDHEQDLNGLARGKGSGELSFFFTLWSRRSKRSSEGAVKHMAGSDRTGH